MTATRPTAATPARAAKLYYLLGTPLFFALDKFWGISVRAAFLDGWPAARYGYYGVCFACGVFAVKVPAKARLIGLSESMANIVLLIFSVMMTYYQTIDRVANGDLTNNPFGPQYAANLAIAGSALAFSYFNTQRSMPA